MENITYYQILGIKETASMDEVRNAWIEKSKLIHPDTLSPDARPTAEKLMAEINEAYKILSNKETRDAYDKELHSKSKALATRTERFLSAWNKALSNPDLNSIVNRMADNQMAHWQGPNRDAFMGGSQPVQPQQGGVPSTMHCSYCNTDIPSNQFEKHVAWHVSNDKKKKGK